jgi:hypothetical protein
MSPPDLSIIVPVFNRADVLRYSLESVRRARGNLALETIVVDDGSQPALDPGGSAIAAVGGRVIRQENRGLLFARLRGLEAATGRHVLFLDSDDLVSPDKLTAQVAALDRAQADVSYTDDAHAILKGGYDELTVIPGAPQRETDAIAYFFISVQPAPHSPVFRREFLAAVVREPLFPPDRLYNPVAEIWFFHNAAPRPGRVVYVPGPLAIVGKHPGARLTDHWERLGVASLAVMEAFARTCPSDTPEARTARQLVGQKAFASWRRLPRGMPATFERRLLALWRTLAPGRSPALGGGVFQVAATVLGAERAGRVLRQIQNGTYDGCRTMTDPEFEQLLRTIPPP